MTQSIEEQVVAAIKAAIVSVNGAGLYYSNLVGRVVEEDTSVIQMPPRLQPLVVVGFDALDPGETLRTGQIGVNVDVKIERGYWEAQGLTPQAALVRIAADIRLAVHAARNTAAALNVCAWQGTSRHRSQDGGATANGCTLRFAVTYKDPRVN